MNMSHFVVKVKNQFFRTGYTVEKVADKGKSGGYIVLNHLIRVGKYTYTDASRGKNVNIVDQLSQKYQGQGKCIVVDRGYPKIQMLKIARNEWGTRIVSTQGTTQIKTIANYFRI